MTESVRCAITHGFASRIPWCCIAWYCTAWRWMLSEGVYGANEVALAAHRQYHNWAQGEQAPWYIRCPACVYYQRAEIIIIDSAPTFYAELFSARVFRFRWLTLSHENIKLSQKPMSIHGRHNIEPHRTT